MIKKFILPLAKAKVVFYTLIWLMILLIIGTIAQKYIGLHSAQNVFFSSWIVWFSYVPLPGGLPTLGLLTLSLMAKLFFASVWSWKNSGVIITHLGSLLLLLGALVTYLYSQEGSMVIYEGESSNFFSDYYDESIITTLPFEIRLIDFEKKFHPGTDTPKSYKSEIILRENGAEWRSIVQMNEPLRYRGYTFFQSSFIIEKDGREATVFTVVNNIGRLFPYISSIIMCIGLLIHAAIRMPRLIRKPAVKALFVGMFMTLSPINAMAADSYDFTEFSRIPILDNGRIKPLDTFAITYLEILSGRDSYQDMSAIEWLAELILDPDKSYDHRIFNIANVNVIDALNLERREKHRYSYNEIENSFYTHKKLWKPLFSMQEDKMSLLQKQLATIFKKTQILAETSRSLSLLFPDFNITKGKLSEELDIAPNTITNFLKLRTHKELIGDMSKDLLARSTDINYEITDEDTEIAELVFIMNKINKDKNSNLLKIIPPQWESNSDDTWISPWGIGASGQGSPASVKFLNLWAGLITAYRTSNYTQFNDLSASIRTASLEMTNISHKVLSIEVSFNNSKPFTISFVLYLAAFLVVLASFIIFPIALSRIAFALVIAGLAFHVAGMGIRMFIMNRPPVTNLYESVIFVGFIASLTGVLIEWVRKNNLGIIIAASMGAILHSIGMKFDADGDTMGMLAAVLDTNFWLATHVITISIGYGTCLVGGVLGHIYLLQRIFNPSNKEILSELFRNMRGIALVALLFTTIGTILGGIWADQSWGRFWGWDPKENGALLIVLWLIFIIHGRVAKIIGELGYAACMICTNIVVACAWFGVNLLNVGLHSYGFTDNAALSFIVFCTMELGFALGAYSLIRIRENNN